MVESVAAVALTALSIFYLPVRGGTADKKKYAHRTCTVDKRVVDIVRRYRPRGRARPLKITHSGHIKISRASGGIVVIFANKFKFIVKSPTELYRLLDEMLIVSDINKKLYAMRIYPDDQVIRIAMTKGYMFDEAVSVCMITACCHKETARGAAPRALVLDIGANVGCISLPLAEHFNVIAFEPNPNTAQYLRTNVRTNVTGRTVDVRQQAVGHMRGQLKLNIGAAYGSSPAAPVNHGTVRLDNKGINVDVVTIDELNLHELAGMKVDVEGAEPMVFYGARETIRRHRPIIIFENNGMAVPDIGLPDEVRDFNIINFYKSICAVRVFDLGRDNYMIVPADSSAIGALMSAPKLTHSGDRIMVDFN